MKLYHGTSAKYAKCICKKILVDANNDDVQLDFGKGFYLTNRREYAEATASDKTALVAFRGFDDKQAAQRAIVTVELDIKKILTQYNCLVFNYKSFKFLRTILDCRTHKGIERLQEDFIIAPIADGDADEVTDYYMDNPFFFNKLRCYANYASAQWSYCKQYVVKNIEICPVSIISRVEFEEGGVWHEQKIEDIVSNQ